MAMFIEYEINKRDIRSVQANAAELPTLAEGRIRLAIRRVALTANNVTYAASGDALRYWSFFPPLMSGVGEVGLVPVWGIAAIVESKIPELPVGELVYGFWPLASHVDLEPAHISDNGFTDNAAHRRELPEIYNRYLRLTGALGKLEPDMQDRLSLLFPLYGTSYLLDDFLAEAGWFGADTLMITSASSKTAIGLARQSCQHAQRPQVIGLTSRSNMAFVASLGCYDRVLAYDEIPAVLNDEQPMLVDLAGDTSLRATIHTHYADRLRYSCAVGTSHWDSFNPAERMPAGPKPVFFFAPAQSKKRRQEWGSDQLQRKMFESWQGFAEQSRQWLKVQPVTGSEAIVEAWQSVASGQADPSVGLVLSFD